ncbi:circularly permuted type 2 ATP-grasp protein [Ilumatobacter nonamiensis]|uniref:circularly permuted type 2 ATP-grasp protein n=1 Tax=Ilumatobacter nonamiensis TaxID=467093 RepID=UPI000345817A|nr:circularly permuted type 2 ATP-grasp protein [Ilumatobacter nonamiensis]
MSTTSDAVDPTDLGELVRRQGAIDRLLMAEGAGHIVHDLPVRSDGRSVGIASRPWRLDPMPYVISADEFTWIEGAVTRRMQMLESLLDDLYGERRLVADGLVDPAVLWGSPGYRLSAVGAVARRHQRRWLSTYAVDIVRTADGVWFAIADHTDTPAGLGYTLLDRSVLTQVADIGDELPRSLDASLAMVRRALVDTTTVDGPRVVMLTSGIDHPAYVDHSYMATQLGFNVVEGPDLVVRESQLWLQTLGGLERIDVLHRRIVDRQLDPLETNTFGAAGIPGVLLADDAGTVTMANAHGTGLIEAPALVGAWDRVGEALTGDEPWLHLRSPRVAAGSTRIDDVLGRPAERIPCLVDGQVVDQPIVLRFHAVATDEGIAVIPGGNGRIIEPHDDPTLPTPSRVKDIWVLGDTIAPSLVVDVRSAPQVDFITSVPTRAAHSLYWLGRASERAEAVARSMRVIAAAAPVAAWDGRATPAMQLLAALTGSDVPDTAAVDPAMPAALTDARRKAVVAASESLEFHIGSMLAESASVREFLSTTTGRVLGEMVDSRDRLVARPDDVDALDTILYQLSAFAGLWSESVVRGPAWYYGDFAKRYERALVAVTSASMAVRIQVDTTLADDARRRGLEAVLASNDSLVAYRRRHRSDVELDAILALILHDQRNPRSGAASVAGMVRNAEAIGWTAGIERLESLGDDLAGFAVGTPPATLERIASALHDLAVELTSTRLVAPPHPTLVRSRLVDPGAVA